MFLPRSPTALCVGSLNSCLFQRAFFTITSESFTVKFCTKAPQTTFFRELRCTCCSSFVCRSGQAVSAPTGYTTQAGIKTSKDNFLTFIKYFSRLFFLSVHLKSFSHSLYLYMDETPGLFKNLGHYTIFWLAHPRQISHRGYSFWQFLKILQYFFQFNWRCSRKLHKSYCITCTISLCLCFWLLTLFTSTLACVFVHLPCSFTVISQIQHPGGPEMYIMCLNTKVFI